MRKPAAMKESQIEAKLVRLVRQHGGLCYKFVSPQNPGVPDRIVITPQGHTVYVELKTVRVLRGLAEVQAFVEEVFCDGIHPASVPAALH